MEISPERIRGWLDGFYGRHDGASEDGLTLTGTSNGDTATLLPPPGIEGVTDVDGLLTALVRPPRIGLLLARKGAVAVGVVDGTAVVSSKVERHYVQGRTAAGGQSQQRYARRRDNQATAAAGRAADVVARVLLPYAPGSAARAGGTGSEVVPVAGAKEPVRALVCGGDRLMIDAVLADQRLAPLLPLRHPHLLECPEPRLAVLQDAAVTARRVRIHLIP
ncbi:MULTISPECIES: acVLRF1 family peptidyl-tRNA hydrolase [unclassified Solwaraspora]|uniref:acVLRF1 family peptidyl-tRNA hydrolase n=1 Tax=unclassified Solwaraspora TaxID=2627926 RepID=UPI00259BEA2A|nr:acVLRF1 family peptidyl-tRNA hydrolase [Solwaraspora sp. WMMA2056]WJK43544.1 acVLRF1 family peptidyl-tRNA hydrolase [Solwaraspora sp. WMMA2056]